MTSAQKRHLKKNCEGMSDADIKRVEKHNIIAKMPFIPEVGKRNIEKQLAQIYEHQALVAAVGNESTGSAPRRI